MIEAVIFDLGNTLVTSNFPLSWENYYSEAIASVLTGIGDGADLQKIQKGKEILLKYNTRVNPREYEIHSDTIFMDLFSAWGVTDNTNLHRAEELFASFFLNRSVLFPDTIPVLAGLKEQGIKTGILTNVAYGLGREYMAKDISQIEPYIDTLLTSVETGYRKPNINGYQQIAETLNVNPGVCLFVGDEEVDVTGANNCGMISVLVDRTGINADYSQQHTVSGLGEVIPLLNGQQCSGADYLGKDGIRGKNTGPWQGKS